MISAGDFKNGITLEIDERSEFEQFLNVFSRFPHT